MADFDPERQVWQWHATVAEYAYSHWPLSEEERRSRLMALAPAWTGWLDRLPAGEKRTLSWLEIARLNLEAVAKICAEAEYQDSWSFLEALNRKLPLPDRTLVLRELIEKVCKSRLEVLRPDDKEMKARLLNDYALALSAVGRRDDALVPAQEAVDIRRQLAQSNPEAFLPDLAMSLNNLGNRLSDLGRRDDALVPAQEAVDIRRQLAQSNPEAFLPDHWSCTMRTFASQWFRMYSISGAARRNMRGTQIKPPFAACCVDFHPLHRIVGQGRKPVALLQAQVGKAFASLHDRSFHSLKV